MGWQIFAFLKNRVPKEEPEEANTPGGDEDDDTNSVADIKDPDDYRQIFQPKHNLGESLNCRIQQEV